VDGRDERRTTSAERREFLLFLNAGVPPNAGDGSYESGAEVESEETSVAECKKDGGDGEIIRETVEE
jgi:hypothetical protein